MHPALTKLHAIEQAATKGPWEAPPTGFDVLAPHEAASCKTIIVNGEIRSEDLSMIAAECSDGKSFYTIYSPEDRACIATARNALPAIIAALAEIEQWANRSGTYGITATVVNEIINRHLEPLK